MRILGFPGSGGGGATSDSFTTIQTPLGTSPVATSPTDTLTFTSSDGSVEITGDATSDTVDFKAVGSGGAPANATYLTLSLNGTLTDERVFTPGTSLSASDGGAGGNYALNTIQDIRVSASPTFTGLTLSGFTTGVVHSDGSGVLSSSLIVNADISASAAIDFSKLATLTSGNILVGSVGNVATSVAVSGDISLSNAGVTAYVGILPLAKLANGTANQLIKANAGATANEFATLSGGTGLGVAFGVGTISLSNTGVTSLIATTDQTTVSGATGAVTIGTVQNIGTGSSPTFTGLTLSGLTPDGVVKVASGVLSSEANLDVTRGGTGLGTLTANNLIVGAGTSDVTFIAPGTSGNILQSNGTVFQSVALSSAGIAPNDATYVTLTTNGNLTNERVLTGTASQIIVTDNGAGSTVVLSLPQNIATGSSPSFAGLTLSNFSVAGLIHNNASGVLSSSLLVNADVAAAAAIARSKLAVGTADHVVINSGTGAFSSEANLDVTRGGTGLGTLTSNNLIVGAGTSDVTFIAPGTSGNILQSNGTVFQSVALSSAGVAPNDAQYLVLAASSGLTVERVFTPGTSLSASDGGAGAAYSLNTIQDIRTSASPTFVGATLSGLTSTGVLYNVSGAVTTEAAFAYDQSANELFIPNITGGTGSGNDITISSTTNATKGMIFLDDSTDVFASQVENTYGLTYTPTLNISGNLTNTEFAHLMPTINYSGGNVTTFTGINLAPTVSIASSVTFLYRAFEHGGTFTSTVNPIFYTFVLFRNSATFTSATTSVPPIGPGSFIDNCTVEATANNVGTVITGKTGFIATGTIRCAGATAIMTCPSVGFSSRPAFNSTVASGALTISTHRGFYQEAATYTTTGTVTVSALVGYEFANQSQTSGNRTVTLIKALNLLQNTGASTTWNIFESGTAPNCLTGDTRLGDTTVPTATLDVQGRLLIAGATGRITEYNDVATVLCGVPSLVANADLTAQGAAIGATTIYAVPGGSGGHYKISWDAKVTRAATISSTLGALTITYTDADGVAQSITCAAQTTAGVIATTAATNTTTTLLKGVDLYVKTTASSNIQYSMAYVSAGATTMQYALRIIVESC